MKLLFGKSKWEMWEAPLQEFLVRAKADGFDAVEVFIPACAESPGEIAAKISDAGLALVAQIVTEGRTPEEHLTSLEKRFLLAAATKPLFVNSHTGSDVFTLKDNLRILQRSLELSRETGLLLTHETHRGRPTFSGPMTRMLLDAMPELFLNADFSHWFCVHESDLSNQTDNVEAAIARARYIHARVGFEEGPQVPDPLAAEWSGTLQKFLALWMKILEARRADGTEFLVVTPEFGPPPYMPCEPHTRRPLADAWEVNSRFLPFLKKQLCPAG